MQMNKKAKMRHIKVTVIYIGFVNLWDVGWTGGHLFSLHWLDHCTLP